MARRREQPLPRRRVCPSPSKVHLPDASVTRARNSSPRTPLPATHIILQQNHVHTTLILPVTSASPLLPNPSCAPHGVETFSSTSASFSHLCAVPRCAHCLGGPSVAPAAPSFERLWSLSGSWDLRMVHSQLCIAPGLKSGFELFKELKKKK